MNSMQNRIRNSLVLFLQKHFTSLLVLFSGLILLLGFFFIIKPFYNKNGRSIDQRKFSKIYAYKKQYRDNLKKLIINYNKISTEKKLKLDLILPNSKRIKNLFSEFEIMAKKRGIILSSISFSQAKNKSKIELLKELTQKNKNSKTNSKPTLPLDIKTINIKVELAGVNYNILKNLVYEIENYNRLLDIENINFEPSSGRTSLSIKTYYK